MADDQKPQDDAATQGGTSDGGVVGAPAADAAPAAPETEAPATDDAAGTETPLSEETPRTERLGPVIPANPSWDPQAGQVVRVHQRITETTKKGQEKERIQVFEGTVIARRHGKQAGATFTVRKEVKGGYGVERIFPLYAPTIGKVEVVKQYRTRRAKLHHLRGKLKKGKKLKEVHHAA